MLSKPKEYIDILLKDIVDTVRFAVANYYQETFNQRYSPNESQSKLNQAMDKVDDIKREIFYVIEKSKDE